MSAPRSLAFVIIAACTGDGTSRPPSLPGVDVAPCELSSASYLIDAVTVANDVNVDLSDPPDGTPDSNQFPDLSLDCFGTSISDAIQRAFSSQHVLWVATVDTCLDATNPYARVSFQRGSSVDSSSPANVMLDGDTGIAGVGAKHVNAIDASNGQGAIPVSMIADASADTSDTGWEDGYNFTAHVDITTSSTIEGYLAVAIDTAASVPLISGALARSINGVIADDPGCPTNCSNPWVMQLVTTFDVNRDGTVDASEVMSRNLDIINVFPSLDLLSTVSGQAVYWPDHDHVADSMGTSFRFKATKVSVIR